MSSRRLLREHDVGRRFVGFGQAEDHEEETEEEEAAAATAAEEIDGEQRNRTKQACLQRENFAQQCLRMFFFLRAEGLLFFVFVISNNSGKASS